MQHLLEETVVVQQGDGLAAVGAIGVVEHQEQAVGRGGWCAASGGLLPG